MRASRLPTLALLFLYLISIVETTTPEDPVKRQTHLEPRPSHYSKPPALLDDEDPRESEIDDSPTELVQRIVSRQRRRQKKTHRWSNPIRYKKPKIPKRPRGHKRPKKVHSAAKRPSKFRARNSQYSSVPSTFLAPPKSSKSIYDLYTPREIPLSDQADNFDSTTTTDAPTNHRFTEESEEVIDHKDRPIYVRDHAPEHEEFKFQNSIETKDSGEAKGEKSNPLEDSHKERIDFHIQGHEGPATYIFGYDTGAGENRMFRLEERHEDGSVTGHYGYVDARGKLQKVRYKATPTQGYVEKRDESKEQKDQDDDDSVRYR